MEEHIDEMKEIIFYEKNREVKNKINKYKISTSEKSCDFSSMGYGGETIIVTLSNGKIIITNDLWAMPHQYGIPKDALIGTIYNWRNARLFGNTVECYIYSKKDKKRIRRGEGEFSDMYGLHLHEKETIV